MWRSVLVALLVVTAGCAGGLGGTERVGTNGDGADDGGESTVTGSDGGETGAVSFYLSDEPNRIDDFEHLNVTVTKVGVKPADTGGEDTEDDEPSDNDSEDEPEADDESAGADRDEEETESDEAESERDGGDGAASESTDGSESKADWIEYEVDDRTIDLTRLRGANSTKLDVLEIPEGEYETVFVHVSEVDGTLNDGTKTNVKLPSNKLQVHTDFAVEAGEELDFVFDISVFEAGNSGKYILKPVISETGTGDEVEIRDVDEADDERAEGGENEGDAEDETGDEERDGNEERDREEGEDESRTEDRDGDGGNGADALASIV